MEWYLLSLNLSNNTAHEYQKRIELLAILRLRSARNDDAYFI